MEYRDPEMGIVVLNVMDVIRTSGGDLSETDVGGGRGEDEIEFRSGNFFD